MYRTPFADLRTQFLAGKFGMSVFLSSLGMLFATSLIAFLVLRLDLAGQWPALPALPRILWLSTLTILASSATMQHGLSAIRRDDRAALARDLLLTLALGAAFLGLQAIAWLQWLAPTLARWHESGEVGDRFALTGFYVFTGLHAAHVLGGLIPMTIAAGRAARMRYDAHRRAGIEYLAMYWHFLGAVWVALFIALMLGV